jgi:Zn-dependent protease with chaperone function
VSIALVLTLAAMGAFALLGPRLAARIPPATATRVLALGCVVIAGASVFVAMLVALTALVQLPDVARSAGWSMPVLQRTDPAPIWLAVLCGLFAAAAIVHMGVSALRRRAATARLRRICRQVAGDERVIVVDEERAEAFATPAAHGRIVVTTGLLKSLSPEERLAVLAHESAHLTRRHAWWMLATDLAVAANPVLRPAGRAVAHAVERWADEDAAVAVADRQLVAVALARAALRARDTAPDRRRPATAAPRFGAVQVGVASRVRALMQPPPRRRTLPVAWLALLLALSLGAATAAQARTDAFLDSAGISAGH